jgi:hypothetical protein
LKLFCVVQLLVALLSPGMHPPKPHPTGCFECSCLPIKCLASHLTNSIDDVVLGGFNKGKEIFFLCNPQLTQPRQDVDRSL